MATVSQTSNFPHFPSDTDLVPPEKVIGCLGLLAFLCIRNLSYPFSASPEVARYFINMTDLKGHLWLLLTFQILSISDGHFDCNCGLRNLCYFNVNNERPSFLSFINHICEPRLVLYFLRLSFTILCLFLVAAAVRKLMWVCLGHPPCRSRALALGLSWQCSRRVWPALLSGRGSFLCPLQLLSSCHSRIEGSQIG